jgi:glutathione S-transferase
MLTFYHAPESRSVRVAALIEEMGIGDRIRTVIVDIPRVDGSGARDPANPHPEGKAPCLVHDGTLLTETGAILLYLTALFAADAQHPMAPPPGHPRRGAFLTWLFWYHSTLEPVLIMQAGDFSHPWLTAATRGPVEATARIRAALDRGPWLCGEEYTAADLLVHSPYSFFPDSLPEDPVIRDWADRCAARPAGLRVMERDRAALARAA